MICPICELEFEKHRPNQKYCSKGCYTQSKINKLRENYSTKEQSKTEKDKLQVQEEAQAFRDYYKELTGREFVSKEKVGGTNQ